MTEDLSWVKAILHEVWYDEEEKEEHHHRSGYETAEQAIDALSNSDAHCVFVLDIDGNVICPEEHPKCRECGKELTGNKTTYCNDCLRKLQDEVTKAESEYGYKGICPTCENQKGCKLAPRSTPWHNIVISSCLDYKEMH